MRRWTTRILKPQAERKRGLGFLRFVQRVAVLLFSVGLCIETTSAQQWEYLGLPELITGIAVQGRDTIYASTPGSIFKTTNSGAVWDTLVQNTIVIDLKMHPFNPQVLYAAVGGSVNPPYGILKTTDGGTNWFHADSGILVNWETGVQVVQFDPLQPETLYAGTAGFFSGNMYKTTNGGRNWNSVVAPGDTSQLHLGVISIAVHPETTDIVYAGTEGFGNLLKTTDGGLTWALTGLQNAYPVDVAIDSSEPLLLYAGVAPNSGGAQRSTDGGSTWTIVNSGLPPQSQTGKFVFDKARRTVYAAVGTVGDSGGVFVSANLGLLWSRMNGLPVTNGAALFFQQSHSELNVGVSNYGIYRTKIVTGIFATRADIPIPDWLRQNFPNPFNSSTKIEYRVTRLTHVTLKLFDIIGNELKVLVDETKLPGDYTINLAGDELSSGFYIYRMTTSAGYHASRKLILLR